METMESYIRCRLYDNCVRRVESGCGDCEVFESPKDDGFWSGALRKIQHHQQLLLVAFCGVSLFGGIFSEWMGLEPWSVAILYLFAYLSGGYEGVVASLQSLRNRQLDIDLLMVVAALGAAAIGAPFEGAMLLFLFSLSNALQDYAMERSSRAIHALMRLRPDNVLCEVDGEQQSLSVDEVDVGALIRLRSGDRVALDGSVVAGESSIDESSLTGESVPVLKQMGSTVYAGTVNVDGSLLYKVSKRASESTLARIVEMVEEAQSKKAQTQRFLERAERYYATAVILFTLGMILFPPWLFGKDFASSFYRAMTVMVVASPCALIISTPAAFLSAIGGAARKGVLFKGGVHLERLASVDIVAFDKTGTLTEGKLRVTHVVALPNESGIPADESRRQMGLLKIAASLERQSEHPIARAIEQSCSKKRLGFFEVEDFRSYTGKGVRGVIEGKRIVVGNPAFVREACGGLEQASEASIQLLLDEGKTVVVVAELNENNSLKRTIGLIALADAVRDHAKYVIAKLRKLGIRRIAMLTGDNLFAAQDVAAELGIDEVYADLLPADKLSIVEKLNTEGKVAMVGDGVNDAPALACAYTGIAMGAAGTDVAMQTADLVLMSSRLEALLHAFAVAKKSRRIVLQNLVFALTVIVVLVTSALFSNLKLPLGVIGHEGSTVLVCLNGLRLLGFRLKVSANHERA